jgi:hypothetical protein
MKEKLEPIHQIAFSKGRWLPDRDPACIGAENFSVMQNARYTDAHPVVVTGYTKRLFIHAGYTVYYPGASGDDGYRLTGDTDFNSDANYIKVGSP